MGKFAAHLLTIFTFLSWASELTQVTFGKKCSFIICEYKRCITWRFIFTIWYQILYLNLIILRFEIGINTNWFLMFQVITGGQYDVDVSLESPTNEVIYRQVRSIFDSHTFVPSVAGEYKVCFSNEFSTISHKIVYMDFQVGEEAPLPGVGDHATVMTQVKHSL